MSRIGTGEGAQAYGHGLYFAGNEGVARSYRDALSSEVYRTPKGDIWSPDNLQHLNVRNQARQNPFELGFAISRAEDLLKTAPSATRPITLATSLIIYISQITTSHKTPPTFSSTPPDLHHSDNCPPDLPSTLPMTEQRSLHSLRRCFRAHQVLTERLLKRASALRSQS